jgi:hypothetical protein
VAIHAAIAALARNSHADKRTVSDTLAQLPELLDHVDKLLADGTIGGHRPNAADFQMLAGVRVLGEFEDIAALLEGRPCNAARAGAVPGLGRSDPARPARPQLSDGSAGIVAISR